MNKHPVILCEGTCKTIVPHTYAGEAERKSRAGETIGFEQLYECDYCGKKRRYGFTAWGCEKGTASWGTKSAAAN